jgi:hypothetical protein
LWEILGATPLERELLKSGRLERAPEEWSPGSLKELFELSCIASLYLLLAYLPVIIIEEIMSWIVSPKIRSVNLMSANLIRIAKRGIIHIMRV